MDNKQCEEHGDLSDSRETGSWVGSNWRSLAYHSQPLVVYRRDGLWFNSMPPEFMDVGTTTSPQPAMGRQLQPFVTPATQSAIIPGPHLAYPQLGFPLVHMPSLPIVSQQPMPTLLESTAEEHDYRETSERPESRIRHSFTTGSFNRTMTMLSPNHRPIRISPSTSAGSLTNSPQPTLVRTSHLQPSNVAHAVSPTFNPYAKYPDGKAELALEGDLMSMTLNWLPAERDVHRRLVEFTRAQSGSVVTVAFSAVLLEERTADKACISCIWREEQNRYYVTSVDVIGLLESLIAARFTVEEKNRIRRNLESLKPDTISNSNPKTESFFRLIMSFPDPKPRNITKNVKVFA